LKNRQGINNDSGITSEGFVLVEPTLFQSLLESGGLLEGAIGARMW